jgi:hypothetical protein
MIVLYIAGGVFLGLWCFNAFSRAVAPPRPTPTARELLGLSDSDRR